jgi:hypothetical protein
MLRLYYRLALLLVFSFGLAHADGMIVGSGSGATCDTVFLTNTATKDTDYQIKGATANVYVGQGTFTVTGDTVFCSVSVWLTKTAGDVSGLNYRVEIWTTSSADTGDLSGGSPVFVSETIAGNNSWSATQVDLDFTTQGTATTGNNYTAVITHDGAVGTTNLAELDVSADGEITGQIRRYESDGTYSGVSSRDMRIILYEE